MAFPLDLTQDALREKGRGVDTDGFDAAMAEQKAKARAAWAGTGETADAQSGLIWPTSTAPPSFWAMTPKVPRARCWRSDAGWHIGGRCGWQGRDCREPDPVLRGSGGQVGDAGLLRTETGDAKITDTKKVAGVLCMWPK